MQTRYIVKELKDENDKSYWKLYDRKREEYGLASYTTLATAEERCVRKNERSQ